MEKIPTKEVLHGWHIIENEDGSFGLIDELDTCNMGRIFTKADAELIVKAVNERQRLLKKLNDAEITIAAAKAANKVNLNTLDKVGEENKRLRDSNKELLEKLNELHHYVSGKVKGYKNVHDSLYFEVINLMANGLHNKIK